MSSSVTKGYVWTGVKTASYSKLSVPGYTTIKYRARPSATDYAAMKDELAEKEGKGTSSGSRAKRLADTTPLESETATKKSKLAEEEEIEIEEGLRVEIDPLDRDDDDSEPENDKQSNASDDDDSDDDDEELAEIQRQLERIKKEKQEEKERKEKEAAEELERERAARMAGANPLMAADGEGGSRVVVKKWYEETIFKNQAQGEQRYKKRVINDTLRNDFQKRFLSKYVH